MGKGWLVRLLLGKAKNVLVFELFCLFWQKMGNLLNINFLFKFFDCWKES